MQFPFIHLVSSYFYVNLEQFAETPNAFVSIDSGMRNMQFIILMVISEVRSIIFAVFRSHICKDIRHWPIYHKDFKPSWGYVGLYLVYISSSHKHSFAPRQW